MRIAMLAPLVLVACQEAPPSAPVVQDGWLRLPAVPGRPGAAYFTIRGGAKPARVVELRSARVNRIELHESMTGAARMMAMKPLDGADVPAGGTLVFAPGERHAMLFDLDPTIQPGDDVSLTARFADGSEFKTAVRAVAAGAPAPF